MPNIIKKTKNRKPTTLNNSMLTCAFFMFCSSIYLLSGFLSNIDLPHFYKIHCLQCIVLGFACTNHYHNFQYKHNNLRNCLHLEELQGSCLLSIKHNIVVLDHKGSKHIL